MYVNVEEEIKTENLDDYSEYFRNLSYEDDYEESDFTPLNADMYQVPFVLNPYYMPNNTQLEEASDMRKKKRPRPRPRPPYAMNPYWHNYGYGYGYPYYGQFPNQGFNPLPWFLLGSIF